MLQLQDDGHLEIHVPRPFTPERPSFTYTHQSHAMAIEDHPGAKTLPKATSTAAIHRDPDLFRSFGVQQGSPVSMSDRCKQDDPQLSLHIVSFEDATLIFLCFPHTLMDAMGQEALLRAWSLVLSDRPESEIPPMLGAHEDALRAAVDADNIQEDLVQKSMTMFTLLIFALNYLWNWIWSERFTERTISLPKIAMDLLRRDARDDLASSEQNGETFISDGDIIVAWLMRAVASSMPRPRPLTILNMVNARYRLPSLMHAAGVFIQNMAVIAFTSSLPNIAEAPLGISALHHRRMLAEQATEAQILANFREMMRIADAGKYPLRLCGRPNAEIIVVTDWTRAKMFRAADFSSALVAAGDKSPLRQNPPGTMVYQHMATKDSNRPTPSTPLFIILGKDHSGGYWIDGALQDSIWNRLDMSQEVWGQHWSREDIEVESS